LTTAPKVFLSYAREDKEKVEDLYQELSQAGFDPWMDTKNIIAGERWDTSINNALRDSDFCIICLSPNSIRKKGYLQDEIKKALDIFREHQVEDIYLIPLKLEECEMPHALNEIQWVEFFSKDGLSRLKNAIQEGIDRRLNNPPEEITKARKSKSFLLGGILIPLVVALISIVPSIIPFFKATPQFVIEKSVLESGEKTVIITANNDAAKKNKLLDIKFDEIEYPKKGIPDEKELGKWRFDLKDVRILAKEKYPIRIRFPGDEWSSRINIAIVSPTTTTTTTITSTTNTTTTTTTDTTTIAAVAPVRPSPQSRYSYKNGMIIDNKSNLMWLKKASGSMNWHEADKFLKKMNSKKLKGYNDWRLPSKQELLKVARFAKKNPGFFPNDDQLYWSSTKKGIRFAYAVNIGDATEEWGNKKNDIYYVRLLRNNN